MRRTDRCSLICMDQTPRTGRENGCGVSLSHAGRQQEAQRWESVSETGKTNQSRKLNIQQRLRLTPESPTSKSANSAPDSPSTFLTMTSVDDTSSRLLESLIPPRQAAGAASSIQRPRSFATRWRGRYAERTGVERAEKSADSSGHEDRSRRQHRRCVTLNKNSCIDIEVGTRKRQ